MTAAARITQADMDRAAKAVKAAGFTRARIIMDLENTRIEIIVAESAEELLLGSPLPSYRDDEWTDDDIEPSR